MGEHRERISSSIQEMMAGPNTILNRTGGDAGYKSILSPNDDHHLEHIFRAHCCLDVWLSWGSLIHKTTHWSYVEVTFKRGGGGDAESKFWGESKREWERMEDKMNRGNDRNQIWNSNPAVTQTQEANTNKIMQSLVRPYTRRPLCLMGPSNYNFRKNWLNI